MMHIKFLIVAATLVILSPACSSDEGLRALRDSHPAPAFDMAYWISRSGEPAFDEAARICQESSSPNCHSVRLAHILLSDSAAQHLDRLHERLLALEDSLLRQLQFVP